MVVARTENKRSGSSLTLGRGEIVARRPRVSLYRPEETILRNHRQPCYLVVLGAVALSALALSFSLVVSVPAAMASGPANAEASELVRLINGERAYLGKAARAPTPSWPRRLGMARSRAPTTRAW